MNSPLAKWGIVFAMCYAVGWVVLMPQVDAWMNARERLAQLEQELPDLRRLVRGTAPSGQAARRQPVREAASHVEAALRQSGLQYERIDPNLKALERGRTLYTVAFTGDTEQFVRFLEITRTSNPRLLVTSVNLRARDPGIGGDCQVAVMVPSGVKSAPSAVVRGRDPFHPPSPVTTMPVMPSHQGGGPPPPPPEHVVMLKLMAVMEVRDLKKPDVAPRFEGLVLNETTTTLTRITPATFANGGIELVFDVPRSLVKVMKGGELMREWRRDESIDQAVLKPERAAQTGGEPPPPPPDLPPLP